MVVLEANAKYKFWITQYALKVLQCETRSSYDLFLPIYLLPFYDENF